MDLKHLKALACDKEPGSGWRMSLQDVNAAIKREGGKEVLVYDHGVIRFTGSDTDWWEVTEASVKNVNDLTLEQWLDEWREKRDQ